MKVGDRVRIVGFPTRYGWMEDLVNDKGTIAAVDDGEGRATPVYAVEGLIDGLPCWFGASFLEPVETSEVA